MVSQKVGSDSGTRFYPSQNPYLPVGTHNFCQNPLFENPYLPVGEPIFNRREPVFYRREEMGSHT